MPELPEAQSNLGRVREGALNRTVRAITLGETSHVDLPSEAERDRLVGHRFTETRRHGKTLFVGSASGPWLAIHLGMTGSLRVYDEGDAPDYARLTVEFEGDRRLAFRCPRKLGSVELVEDPETYVAEQGYGPDALDIDEDSFADTIGTSDGALKSALMDQKKLAGLGNLWSDETLFQSGHDPEAAGSDLTDGQLSDLHATMRAVLQGVLDTGANYEDLPGTWLIHRREDGAQCPRCPGTIRKRQVGGRSAHACDQHQG
ncbi:DNA-formamidopyrimidine glycosylase family protein [Roseobacter sp. HKCCA0434]|uniref:DNA-formamidopyrimidine glycosylase family protein n=1 Tax=Roseobacter sp. HKCCA0434 TaxID=3079297 RepID=UPI002905BE55|nr:DNA-formamidopyrimidine glycosylase family protein [Roseobacter sp. HKCCA0434]